MSSAKDDEATDSCISNHFKRVTKLAFETTLNSGNPVTIAKDGAIWSYVKTGDKVERTKLKDIDPDVPAGRSNKFTVKL